MMTAYMEKKISRLLATLLLGTALVSCEKTLEVREALSSRSADRTVVLDVFGATDPDAVKSDLVSPTTPDVIYDLNIWQYASSGKLLATFYVDELSGTGGHVRVPIRTDAVTTDRLVVVANAGKAVSAPASSGTVSTFPYDYSEATQASYHGILATGTCTSLYTNAENGNLEGNVSLKRAMARFDIRFQLSGDWTVSRTGTFGFESPMSMAGWKDANMHDLKIHRAATRFSFRPSVPTSIQTFAVSDASMQTSDGDFYPGTLYSAVEEPSKLTGYYALYSLPNAQSVSPSADWYTRGGDYAKLTYASAILTVKESANGYTAGDVGIRFLPCGEQSSTAGITGGNNYRTTVTISATDDGVNGSFGRRIDSRFVVPASTNVEVGKDIEISFAQPCSGGAWPYLSLSPTSVIKNDGVFGITDTYSGSAYGDTSVSLNAISPGESTLYLKIPFEGKYLTGSIKLTAYKKTVIDVGGDDDGGGGNNEYD